ncbi:unnamed protein product, partial [marine sediment metagenome]
KGAIIDIRIKIIIPFWILKVIFLQFHTLGAFPHPPFPTSLATYEFFYILNKSRHQ